MPHNQAYTTPNWLRVPQGLLLMQRRDMHNLKKNCWHSSVFAFNKCHHYTYGKYRIRPQASRGYYKEMIVRGIPCLPKNVPTVATVYIYTDLRR